MSSFECWCSHFTKKFKDYFMRIELQISNILLSFHLSWLFENTTHRFSLMLCNFQSEKRDPLGSLIKLQFSIHFCIMKTNDFWLTGWLKYIEIYSKKKHGWAERKLNKKGRLPQLSFHESIVWSECRKYPLKLEKCPEPFLKKCLFSVFRRPLWRFRMFFGMQNLPKCYILIFF